MGLSKSNKVSLLFFFIFILGVIGFIAYINISLNKNSSADPLFSPEDLQNTSLTIQD
ncbi:hypothetical protein RM545_11150 [Zunongwangia sp. F260]|uniref:Uncharacterized protein n=2 Tax=Autumnicola TaxID=3160927 RepID=A0ABU3CLQ3_9FLAO|nr:MULTISPECIES: hypothetical protein [unclassified Zunongwangia]MDT0647246.1 hypothetical protein [Zunongwangia sp. F260]MDT0685526.1 hypothetical protein [Zunongwangia sp. F225]